MTTPTSIRRHCRPVARVLAVLALLSVAFGQGSPTLGQEADTYFDEATSQRITRSFLSAWQELDGPERLGLPVTSAVEAEGRIRQYFQLGVLQADGDGDEVELMPAGRALLDRPDPSNPLRIDRRAPAPREARAFTALDDEPDSGPVIFDRDTGHSVEGNMLEAYEELGGEDVLGAPLSEAYRTDARRIQWFEMGRLEVRSGDVGLGPVGSELAVLDDADLGPKKRGSLATVDLATGGFGPAFSPVRLQIPEIGVDATIETVGIVDDVMQTPADPLNVGWYEDFGQPGDGGNTVMAGHRDWYTIGPVVFWDLGALQSGSEVLLLDEAGTPTTYLVYETFTVDPTADTSDVLADQGGETLTLITCGGEFSLGEYDQRIVVRARRA